MKLSSILCASVLALAALAFSTDGASSGTTVKGSKSNSSEKAASTQPATPAPAETSTINSTKSNTFKTVNSDPKAVQDCKVHGGSIGKDPNGQDACITYSASKPSGCSQWIGDICVIWKH